MENKKGNHRYTYVNGEAVVLMYRKQGWTDLEEWIRILEDLDRQGIQQHT